MEVIFSYLCSAGYLLVAVKEASSIFVNQLNAKNLKSIKTQFQFQFELSLAQLSPSLFQYFPWRLVAEPMNVVGSGAYEMGEGVVLTRFKAIWN